MEHFVIFCGHFVFLILTRPSAHNKNFPYHVRTTQIGIMQAMATNTNLGPNTLDHFANGGSYGVSAPATGKYAYLSNKRYVTRFKIPCISRKEILLEV